MPSMMATAVEGFSPSGRMGARAGRAEAESPVGSVLIVLISSNAYISPPYTNARDCPSFRRRAMRGINMVTVYDVPAEQLILKTAQKLKENPNIVPPEWAEYVKTGRHTERGPTQDDWWYTRAASIMRKLYVKGPMGSSRLAAEYGGFADKGSMPNRAVKGSRNIARKCMMQLEAAGYLVSKDKEGRAISPAGQSLLDNTAKEVYDEMRA